MRAGVALLVAFAAALAPAAAAEAPPYPHSGVLSDALSDAVIRVACEPPGGPRMRCAFTEIRVEPGQAGEPPLPSKAECADIPALRSAMVDGVPPPGVDAEAFAARFARQTAPEKHDLAALFAAVADYCADRTGSAEALLKVMRDRQSRSCRLAIQTYSLDFDLADGRWETRSAPAKDGCNTVRFGRFEPVDGDRDVWTYRIGSRSDAGPSCPTTPETDHLYFAGGGDVPARCDYLRFTD